jgi:hypothetical protein
VPSPIGTAAPISTLVDKMRPADCQVAGVTASASAGRREATWQGDNRVVQRHITAGWRADSMLPPPPLGTTSPPLRLIWRSKARRPEPPSGRWNWVLIFEAVPPGGIDVMLNIQGPGPLQLRVLAYHDGLPPLPQLAPLPEDLTWSRRLPNATVVAVSHQV